MKSTAMKRVAKVAGDLPLELNFSYRISILHALIGRQTTGIYMSRGLTSHQWKVLSVLYRRPPISASRITELVTLDKAAISRAVIGLLELGFIDRTLDPMSGSIFVILKDSGRDLYVEMMHEMQAIQTKIFAGLSAKAQRDLFASLDQVEQSLRNAAEPPKPATSSSRRVRTMAAVGARKTVADGKRKKVSAGK
jgi:DNA-binding MarR family transcriptional regulator